MTTIGTEEGRNYARVNLKLVDQDKRSRSQKDLEKAIRKEIKPIPGIEGAFGFDRSVWVNLLGPDPDTMTIETAITDSKALTAPFVSSRTLKRHRSWTIAEYICEENNHNFVDSSGKAGIWTSRNQRH